MYDVTPDQPSPQLLVVSLVECIGYTVYGVLTELQTDRSGSLIRGFAFYQSLNENEKKKKKAHRTHSILHSPSRTAPDESVRDVQSFAILRPGQPPCLYRVCVGEAIRKQVPFLSNRITPTMLSPVM